MQAPEYIMRSPRLLYRLLQANDFSLIAPILQDAQTMYAWEHGFSYDEVCQWLAGQMQRYREDGCGYLAALDRKSLQLVALAGALREEVDGERHTGIGYIVDRRHWGQGFGVECAKASLGYAFTALQAPQVLALIRPENVHSVRVAEQCGMKRIGSHTKTYYGKEMPHAIYAIPCPHDKNTEHLF